MPNDNIIYLQSFKWSKPCAKGDGNIAVGEEGWWDKDNKKYYHTKCYRSMNLKKLDKPNAVPKLVTGGEGTSPNQRPSSHMESGALVSLRVKRAIEIAHERQPNCEEYHDYLTFVSEILANLRSTAWLDKDK